MIIDNEESSFDVVIFHKNTSFADNLSVSRQSLNVFSLFTPKGYSATKKAKVVPDDSVDNSDQAEHKTTQTKGMILSNQLDFQLLTQGDEIIHSDGCASYSCSKLPEKYYRDKNRLKGDTNKTRLSVRKKREAGLKATLPLSGIALLYNNTGVGKKKNICMLRVECFFFHHEEFFCFQYKSMEVIR